MSSLRLLQCYIQPADFFHLKIRLQKFSSKQTPLNHRKGFILLPSPAPPAQPWSQVSVAPHTQTPLRDALPFESGPWAPLRCPTAGISITPLVPLVRSLGAWLELPRPSRWLLRTIRLGYAIQFTRRPPKFRGIRFTSVLSQDAPVHLSVEPGCTYSS